MKDLSNLDKITKNNNKKEVIIPIKNDKQKKILIIAVVAIILCIGIGSKLINKYRNVKAEKKQVKKELTIKAEKTKEETKLPSLKKNTNDMTFTFYTNLKKSETVDVEVNTKTKQAEYKYTYIFQIASFRNMNETKYYVQKLDSQGLKPKFQKVGNWIRMYIGPYSNKRAIAPDIIKLQRIGINSGFIREVSKVKIITETDKLKSNKENLK